MNRYNRLNSFHFIIRQIISIRALYRTLRTILEVYFIASSHLVHTSQRINHNKHLFKKRGFDELFIWQYLTIELNVRKITILVELTPFCQTNKD
jgi:hypothetical protein